MNNTPSMNTLSQLRICTQKLTPQTEKHLNAICMGHCPANQQKLRAAYLIGKRWPKGSTIRIAFLSNGDGVRRTPSDVLKSPSSTIDPLQKIADTLSPIELIKKVIMERIMPLVNLNITFIDNPSQANVRVGFDSGSGAWSYVGTECQTVSPAEATINFGWIDVPTIMHECYHMMGFIHEHQNPKGEPIQWDKDRVYAWAKQTQGWGKEITDTNILNKYNTAEINGSNFDPKSIMLYFFPAFLTTNGKGTQQNLRLSGDDVIWLYNDYPRDDITPAEFYMNVYGQDIEQAVKDSEREAKRQNGGITPFRIGLGIVGIGIILVLLSMFRSRKKLKRRVF